MRPRKREPHGEPILIPCEGADRPVNRFQGVASCKMCGEFVVTDTDGNAVLHDRDDLLARIDRGDFR